MLSESERNRLLVEWNDTATDYPSHKCIQDLFEQQVNDHPDAVALVSAAGEMTYGELNARANQLAHYLRSRAIVPDTRVAICLQRSPEMIITLLAILKASGAYVPLDPAYPRARLQLMLEDSRARVLLTERSLLSNLPRGIARRNCEPEPAESAHPNHREQSCLCDVYVRVDRQAQGRGGEPSQRRAVGQEHKLCIVLA
jgi:non-ribosomal peptide synthetase component F